MANIVQRIKGYVVVPIVGNDFGPGTVGALTMSIGFPKPVTTGNSIFVALTGHVEASVGSTVDLGPRPSFFNLSGGISHALHNYTAGWALNTKLGKTAVNYSTVSDINDRTTATVSRPNPNNNAAPGWESWACYGAGGILLADDIAPDADYGPTGAGPFRGDPGGTMADPVPGYVQCVWEPGNNAAMGMYAAANVTGGSKIISMIFAAFNGNPLFGTDGLLIAIAAEVDTDLGGCESFGTVQNNSSTIAIDTTNSLSGTNTTTWPSVSGCSAQVSDLSPGVGTDFLFASLSDGPSNRAGLTPTLTPSGIYTLIDTVTPLAPHNTEPFTLWGSPFNITPTILQPQIFAVN